MALKLQSNIEPPARILRPGTQHSAAFDTTKEGAKCIKIVKPKTGKCVRIVGPPTYDAVCESAIGNGKEPPGAMVKCVLGMLKDRKTFNEAAAAGVDYKQAT